MCMHAVVINAGDSKQVERTYGYCSTGFVSYLGQLGSAEVSDSIPCKTLLKASVKYPLLPM